MRKTKVKLGLLLSMFLVFGIMVGVNPAFATPVYLGTYVDMYLKQNTFPDDLNEEKVFLDKGKSSTITGHVGSQDGTPLVLFSSTTDILDAANGFANIKAVDGYINNITITAPGYWFEDLIFSVNFGSDANNDLTITAISSGGTDISLGRNYSPVASWSKLLGNGENRILVLSKSGNLMQSVTLNSVNGAETIGGFDELKQTQISGLTRVVPEPGTLLLLGLGLVGLAGLRRKF